MKPHWEWIDKEKTALDMMKNLLSSQQTVSYTYVSVSSELHTGVSYKWFSVVLYQKQDGENRGIDIPDVHLVKPRRISVHSS